ncbi:MAG: transglutaminase-like domain-containing protein [Pirellulaceae bacterium]
MSTWSRRRVETIVLSVVALSSVIPHRFFVESRGLFLAEAACLCIAFVVAEFSRRFVDRSTRAKRVADIAAVTLALIPFVFAVASRTIGRPIAFEIATLTVFGCVSLAMAIGATTHRIGSLALIISGFLVLFSASISDSSYAVVFPVIWMLGCVWHLIANHWERLDLAMPESVQRSWSLRPSVVIVTLLVLVVAGYAMKDRITSSKRLTAGLMPTSGGSEWSDPSARSGVGSGDAAVAAKDRAESFGAVDSDIFLESTESSLFDMFNDTIGEPKQKNKKQERAQAMGPENFIQSHARNAKSEQGGGSFSTDRLPPKKHHHFKDATDASVVQWDGPTGIRLAMQRYDTFDGHDWNQSADLSNEKLARVPMADAVWFFDPFLRGVLQRNPDAASVGLLKVIRLDAQRLPVPMLTAGVHIKEIDRQDFFGIAEDGSFFMPGREKVPPLTVVHVASVVLMEDEIHEKLVVAPAKDFPENGSLVREEEALRNVFEGTLTSPTASAIQELVQSAIANHTNPVDQLNACVEELRTRFVFDREGESSATSLDEFLRSRRGGDHLFATTAALMARQIGLSSRLVTGFYVRPDAFDLSAGHASVLPQDVHVWAEIRLNDGRWFEIEPTPGYMQPHYQPSWSLAARRFAVATWPLMSVGMLTLLVAWFTRRLWIDCLLTAVWSLGRWLRPRRRIRLAIGIIEARARLAGHRRPTGKSQRAWLEQLTRTNAKIATAARNFSDAAMSCFSVMATHRRAKRQPNWSLFYASTPSPP